MKVSDIGKDKHEVKNNKIIWNYMLLDCSGSMSGAKFEAAKEGILGELKSMMSDTATTCVNFKVAVVEFEGNYSADDRYRRYSVKPCFIEFADYKPGRTGGSTPLYATIASVLLEIRGIKPVEEPCIVTVFTDGGENSSWGSPYANPTVLKALIDECKENNISVKFIGTKLDVETMIKNVGIKTGDTYTHDNTRGGVERAFMATSSARSSYTKGYAGGASADSLNSMDFFVEPKGEMKDKKEDKKP